MATVPSIITVYPANTSLGIPIGDQITVTFDQAMDEDSIDTGTFLLHAPDDGIFFGGVLNPFEEPAMGQEDILSSPYYGGIVKGSISFSRVDASGAPVSDDLPDYTGVGNLWYTVATFTPEGPLSPSKEYTVLVSGDEAPDNAFDSGVKTKTVFDPQALTLTGTGAIYSGGGYTGTIEKTFVVEIISGGSTGDAVYQWWDATAPLSTYNGVTVTGRRELDDGMYITCDPDGNFVVGDQWSIVCIPAIQLANTYEWTFTTGSGSILIPPSQSSASGIATGTTTLEVLSMTPKDQATHLDPDSIQEIVIVFNQDLDEDTITDANIRIWTEPVNGNTYNTDIVYEGEIAKILSVDGNTLTIQIS